jgi:hypothetical protein
MLKRLLLILQCLSLIPPIGTFLFLLTLEEFLGPGETVFVYFLTIIPFTLIILIKYIIYGKFYMFKIEDGDEK